MKRETIIKRIEAKAQKILELRGYEDGISGRIGDGCEIAGEDLWVIWPTADDESTVGLYRTEVMDDMGQTRSPHDVALFPGWEEVQVYLDEVEDQIEDETEEEDPEL